MRIFSLYKQAVSFSEKKYTSVKKKKGEHLKCFLLYHKPPQK